MVSRAELRAPGGDFDRSIVSIIRSLTVGAHRKVPSADVDDVVSDAITDALAALRPSCCGYVSTRELSAVAHAVLARRVADYWRARHRSLRVELLGDGVAALSARDGAPAPLIMEQRWCVARLGCRQRMILEAVESGKSCADAAAKLGLPVKEVVRIVKNLASRVHAERLNHNGLPGGGRSLIRCAASDLTPSLIVLVARVFRPLDAKSRSLRGAASSDGGMARSDRIFPMLVLMRSVDSFLLALLLARGVRARRFRLAAVSLHVHRVSSPRIIRRVLSSGSARDRTGSALPPFFWVGA